MQVPPKTVIQLSDGTEGVVMATSYREGGLLHMRQELVANLDLDQSLDVSGVLSRGNAACATAGCRNTQAAASTAPNNLEGQAAASPGSRDLISNPSDGANCEASSRSEEASISGYSDATVIIGSDDDQENNPLPVQDTPARAESNESPVVVELKIINKQLVKILHTQKRFLAKQECQLKESRKLRRLIGLQSNRNGQAAAAVEDQAPNPEPVMHNDTNLATLGERNLSPSEFGILLARQLWSDEELRAGLLLPRRRSLNNARQGMSPTRSGLFVRACRSRFGDEVATETARDAANQLGCDLRRGIRARRDPLHIEESN
jgi:hypothetical protein